MAPNEDTEDSAFKKSTTGTDRNISKRERALRFNGFVITDEADKIVFEDKKRYSQHFYPLAVIDYARAMYNYVRNDQQLPILSVDSHDVLRCDFNCDDCLSAHGTNFPVNDFPKDNFKMPIEMYKDILRQISDYSEKRGFKGVRFEQSGEGNPDYYPYRKQILEFAKSIGMQSVYVSTGSQIDYSLMEALVNNSSFVRLSFPGIGENGYRRYSHQNAFTFKDALKKLEHFVQRRDKNGNHDLMIGARVAIREDHDISYYDFAKQLKDLGVDTVQIVKILVPEGKKPTDFPLNSGAVKDLERTATLDDNTFNVGIPHGLDYMVYSREIEDRSDFPPICYSGRIQPVLAGRSMFVCTISNVMYSNGQRFGTFSQTKGELEGFLSDDNFDRTTLNVPSNCKACGNIYDNMLMFKLYKLFKSNPQKLNFQELLQ